MLRVSLSLSLYVPLCTFSSSSSHVSRARAPTKGAKVRRPLRGCTLFIEGHKTHKRCAFSSGRGGGTTTCTPPPHPKCGPRTVLRTLSRFRALNAALETRIHADSLRVKERADYIFCFFFYFYANGVFFFSRDGAVTQEREKKKRRRNIRLVFRLRSFNRRWISYLEQGFVRIIENTFRFIVSLKCEFSIEPISRTRQESPFPVPLTKWRLRYFRAVISHVNIVVLPDCATYLITTTTVLRREISFSDASVRTFYMLRDAVVRI